MSTNILAVGTGIYFFSFSSVLLLLCFFSFFAEGVIVNTDKGTIEVEEGEALFNGSLIILNI